MPPQLRHTQKTENVSVLITGCRQRNRRPSPMSARTRSRSCSCRGRDRPVHRPALPGQALGYLVGQREILRLRDDARSRLGAAFDIRDFHSAVLDHGSLPLAVLSQVVADWAASAAGNRGVDSSG